MSEEYNYAYMSPITRWRVNVILNHLSIDSLKYFLKAIDSGRFDGHYYGEFYMKRYDNDIEKVKSACLIGWAAIFSGVSHHVVQSNFHKFSIVSSFFSMWVDTYFFTVSRGDTPEFSPRLAALRRLVIARIKSLDTDKPSYSGYSFEPRTTEGIENVFTKVS